MTVSRKAAFIDRDGVINRELGYVHRIEDFEFLPNALAGLQTLEGAGFLLVVVTNQAGVARGLYSEEAIQTLSNHMTRELGNAGVTLAGIYHCPHHPEGSLPAYRMVCDCRKPMPGLLFQAAKDLNIDLTQSVLVGDKLSDIAAGQAAGVRSKLLVRSGHAVTGADEAAADLCVEDLAAAAAWIVRQTG